MVAWFSDLLKKNPYIKGVTEDILLWGMGAVSLLLFPISLWRTINVFRPGGYGINTSEFFSFGWKDVLFRTWYLKLAKDFREYGRLGYSWDDGLGLALGPRIYNNLATYWLLDKLGIRRMMAAGLLLFVASLSFIAYTAFGAETAFILAVVLVVSPAIVQAFSYLGKPELFWWWTAIVALYCLLNSQFWIAGILWSLLAFSNLPVAVMTAFALGPAGMFLAGSTGTNEIALLIACMLPGFIKILWRVRYMHASGFLKDIASEQTGLWHRRWMDISREILLVSLFISSIWLSYSGSHVSAIHILLLTAPASIMYYLNWRLIYMNDEQTFRILIFIISATFAIHNESTLGLLLSALIIIRYTAAPFSTSAINLSLQTGLKSLLRMTLKEISDFPHFTPQRRPSAVHNELTSLFKSIPPGARVISESNGKLRMDLNKRTFWAYIQDILLENRISLANDIYTDFVEKDLSLRYTSRFCPSQLSPVELKMVANRLGCQYIIAFSKESSNVFQKIGYDVVGTCVIDRLEVQLVDALRLNKIDSVFLLKYKIQIGTVEPFVQYDITRNVLKTTVKAGTYIFRFRYDPRFECLLENNKLEIKIYKPFLELPTAFMKVMVPSDGKLQLIYNCATIGK